MHIYQNFRSMRQSSVLKRRSSNLNVLETPIYALKVVQITNDLICERRIHGLKLERYLNRRLSDDFNGLSGICSFIVYLRLFKPLLQSIVAKSQNNVFNL
eukprot:6213685-Pleurochrysis_carterae.AAC.2